MKHILICSALLVSSTLGAQVPVGMPVAHPSAVPATMSPKISLGERRVEATQSMPIFAKRGPVSRQYLTEEIGFWSRQMSEHALFLFLGLNETEVPELKERGLELHEKFQAWRDRFAQQGRLSKRSLRNYKQLLGQLRAYKKAVLKAVLAGWSGWLYPSFVQHVLLELDYHVQNINGVKRAPAKEVEFWNIINGDHANFAKHLIDPTEVQLVEQADQLAKQFAQLGKTVRSEDEMMIQLSLNATKELDAYGRQAQAGIKNRSIRSIIHPVLIAHVLREGQRASDILTRLGHEAAARQFRLPAVVESAVAPTVMPAPATQAMPVVVQ